MIKEIAILLLLGLAALIVGGMLGGLTFFAIH